ncbi:MAG: hypothetical protein ACPKQO_04250 [Nitrososphaeraceae archaeon]
MLSIIIVVISTNPINIFASYNPDGTYESNSFIISNMSAIYDKSFIGDKFNVIGFIENKSNETFNDVFLIGEFYDQDNNLIGLEKSSPFFNVNFPENKSPFKFEVFLDELQFDHYKILVGVQSN